MSTGPFRGSGHGRGFRGGGRRGGGGGGNSGSSRGLGGPRFSEASTNSPTPPHGGSVKILRARPNDASDITSDPGLFPVIMHSPSSMSRTVLKSFAEEGRTTSTSEAAPDGNTLPTSSVRLMEDGSVNKVLMDYLTSSSLNYHVVAVIGAQNSGKSTFASMLAGNEPHDAYGEYVFRPASKDSSEKGAIQTTGINIFVTKERMVILDVQAMNSASVLEHFIRSQRKWHTPESNSIRSGGFEDDGLRLLEFILEVSHTILLVVDWFLDVDIVRTLLLAEKRASTAPSKTAATRKVNLVVAQCRSKPADFNAALIAERAEIVKGIFEGTRLVPTSGKVSMPALRLPAFENASIDKSINYVVFPEIKPRPKTDAGPGGAMQGVESDNKTTAVSFTEVMDRCRLALLTLPRAEFVSGVHSERDWLTGVVHVAAERFLLASVIG